jgi:hypothetical protein
LNSLAAQLKALGGNLITMLRPRSLALTLATAVAACAGASVQRTGERADAARPDSTWIARQPVACGEVRGRILDQTGEHPMIGAYVTLDSFNIAVTTDSLGRFRMSLPRQHESVRTRPTYLRVRRIGAMEIRVLLPSDFGYVVEVLMPAGGLHIDHVATLRIKSPAFCVRPT